MIVESNLYPRTTVAIGLRSALCLACLAVNGAPAAESNAVRISGGVATVTIVSNQTRMQQRYSIATRLTGRCMLNPSWLGSVVSDERLAHDARVEIEPGSWFAKWVLFANDDVGCEAIVEVKDDDGNRMAAKSLTLPERNKKPELLPYTPGKFEVSVGIAEDLLDGRLEPEGRTLQMQVLLRNRTREPRLVAILSRQIVCKAAARFDWIVGPGEAHPEMGGGPVTVGADGWVVLGQRLRGSGDGADCSARIEIAENLRSRETPIMHESPPPVWRRVESIRTSLITTARATYQ